MIIENVIEACTAVKIIQYILKEEPRIIFDNMCCSTGGEYEFYNESNSRHYRIYKTHSPDNGIVISNIQSDREALMSLNTTFYHHSNSNDLIIYGSTIDPRSTVQYSIPIENDFQYYKDPLNLNNTIHKHGNGVTYALVLNALCRDMNLDNFKMSSAKVKEFLNDCLCPNWYDYYKGIV